MLLGVGLLENWKLDAVAAEREDVRVKAPDERPESVGVRLRRLRLERGLSQRDLAVPGVSYAYISRIEAGTRQPSVKALRKVAAKLDVSPDYLETGSDLRREEERELQIADAELELRIGGDIDAVERKLRSLLDEVTTAGDPASTLRTRIALGFAAALQGRHSDAVEELEAVVRDGQTSPTAQPDVYSTLGRAYAALGTPERAVRLFAESLERIEQEAPEDIVARTRFATLLSYALADAGELDRAAHVVQEALEAASEIGDSYTLIRLYWSLARLSSMQGRQSAALRYARRAVALLEASDDTLHLGRAHILCGSILTIKGEHSRAAKHLARAEELLGPRPEPLDQASLRTEQARNAGALGGGAQAVSLAREALEILGDDDPAERGVALWALAQGLELEGDLTGAELNFEQAAELLQANGRWRDVKLATEAWTRMLRNAGRERDADAVEERYAPRLAAHPVP